MVEVLYDSSRKFRNKFVVATKEIYRNKSRKSLIPTERKRNRKTSGRRKERQGGWVNMVYFL